MIGPTRGLVAYAGGMYGVKTGHERCHRKQDEDVMMEMKWWSV
jgi:hypothetical protein